MKKTLLVLFVLALTSVYAQVPIGNPQNLYACDTNADMVETFNLNLNNSLLLNGATGYTITYYVMQEDAQFGTNPIPNPQSYINVLASTTNNSQTIYARMTSNVNNLFSVASFTINPLPVVTDLPPLEALDCDQYDLTQNSDLFNGQYELTYHITESGANSYDMIIPDPSNFSGPGPIFIRATLYNPDFSVACYYVVEQELEQYEVPPVYVNINGNSVTVIIEGAGEGYTYSVNGMPAQQSNIFYNLPPGTYTFTIQLPCGLLYAISVEILPLSGAIGQPANIVTCDADGDGFEAVDLTVNNAAILNQLDPDEYSIAYYTSYEMLQANTPIVNPAQFVNETSFQQYIYAKVWNNESPDIYGTAYFAVEINIAPQLNDAESLGVIDADGNQIGVFNLTGVIPSLTGGEELPEIEFSFFTTQAAAMAGAPALTNFESYVSATTVIYYRAENMVTGCYTIGSFELVNLPSDYETPAPDADAEQDFAPGATLADIEIEGQNIIWYSGPGAAGRSGATTDDDNTPLPPDTLLEDGMTYYASQTMYGIESLERQPVTVHLSLGVEGNTMRGFSFYPNPVKDVLTLNNTTAIEHVTVYNMLGQAVINAVYNAPTATIDLSGLSNQVYIVKVSSGGKEKTIKVVKQ